MKECEKQKKKYTHTLSRTHIECVKEIKKKKETQKANTRYNEYVKGECYNENAK